MKNRVFYKTFIIISIIMGSGSWYYWFGSPFRDTMNEPNLSTNYLYKDKVYNITLEDVYDEDLDKVYTGAYFQSQYFNSSYEWEQIHNESADSGVDNTYSVSPSNTSVIMLNGIFDGSNNMKANDDAYSNFTSAKEESNPNEYIDSITYDWGTDGGGTIENTYTDDTNYKRINAKYLGNPVFLWWIDITLNFDPALAGRDFYISAHITTSGGNTGQLRINGADWKTGSNIDFDDELKTGVNSITFRTDKIASSHYSLIYYFKLVEVPSNILNFTTDLDFNGLDTSKVLALDVSSYHYTNVSQIITGEIYNYTSSSYVEMFSSSNTVETLNYFMDNTSVSDLLNGSNNLRLRYSGSDSTSFKLLVDYVSVQFFHKMDLWHEVSFNMTGIWRYRWEIHGSLQYTEWNNFEVVEPVPNFHAVSESSYTTRWILQGSETTVLEDLHDSIDSNAWILIVSDNDTVIDTDDYVSDDSVAREGWPDFIQGTYNWWAFAYSEPPYDNSDWGYIKYEFPYLYNNYTQNSTFYTYEYTPGFADFDKIYHTYDFDELTLTWNNKPNLSTFQKTFNGTYNDEWVDIDIGSPYYYYVFVSTTDTEHAFMTRSKQYAGTDYDPRIRHHLSKIYYGSGYMYMQTDETETIALRSKDYGTHYNLSSGDYFEVDLQTSSDSQIDLILLNNSVVQKTLTLSQTGNTNFNKHIVQVSVDEVVEFDQLKISSTFEDTDYIKVYDIKTYKYEITGDYADLYVGSHNQRDIYLTPDTYNLRILEEGTKKVDTNITIGSTDYYYIYEPIETIQCRLTLFSLEGEYLQFEDYHVKINRSLNQEYNEFWLVDTIFDADEETYVYIEIYDRFDALIDTFSKLASSYIDLDLEVYQLQIKNQLAKETTLDINSTHIYPLLAGDSLYFMLVKDYYQIGYYDENNDYNQFTVYLDENKAYELNTTYFDVYFSIFNFDGLGLDKDLVRFYINNERKDFGFNLLKQDTNNLLVLDYFNATLFNQNINLRAYTEYNILVEVYTLILYNNYSHPVTIELERNNIEIEQIIPSWSGLSYRFLPNVEYKFRIYYLNETLIEEKEIELDSNNKIVSFGFFEEEVPIDPGPIIAGYETMFWFVVFFAGAFGFALVVIILLRRRNNTSRRYYSFPKKTRNKPGTYNNSLAKRRDNDYG